MNTIRKSENFSSNEVLTLENTKFYSSKIKWVYSISFLGTSSVSHW